MVATEQRRNSSLGSKRDPEVSMDKVLEAETPKNVSP